MFACHHDTIEMTYLFICNFPVLFIQVNSNTYAEIATGNSQQLIPDQNELQEVEIGTSLIDDNSQGQEQPYISADNSNVKFNKAS